MHHHAQFLLIFPLTQEVLFQNQDSAFFCLCQGGSISFSMVLVDGVAVVTSAAAVTGWWQQLVRSPDGPGYPELGEEEGSSLGFVTKLSISPNLYLLCTWKFQETEPSPPSLCHW